MGKKEEDNLAEMVGYKQAGQQELKDIEVERPDIEEPNIIIINYYYFIFIKGELVFKKRYKETVHFCSGE